MENKKETKLTPMMKQYLEIKKNYQRDILFFRMGDFYEMFFEDAEIAAKILDIALTSRQNEIPMCGIPFHAADNYLGRLIKAGKRVAICEQLETIPSSGNIVRREVVRVITPGTVIESNLLQSDENNFLASIIITEKKLGLGFVDISTGDLFFISLEKSVEAFRAELTKFNPREIIFKDSLKPEDEIYGEIVKNKNIAIYRINEWLYDLDYLKGIVCDIYGTNNLKGLGLELDLDIITIGSVLQYLKETQKNTFSFLKTPRQISSRDKMILDEATISNLELIYNQQDSSKKKTLLALLNQTKTPMGKRLLERNILEPLLAKEKIEARLNLVQYFVDQADLLSQIASLLKKILDLERLISRFALGRVFPRNFLALRNSLESGGEIKKILDQESESKIKSLAEKIPDLEGLATEIREAIDEEPALSPEQGRVIRAGFNAELDHLYSLKIEAKNWILEYQEEEKKKLGANTLKIKYNKILGYYFEISKGQAGLVPENYYRKQTLVNSERFTTDKLQKFEADILSASDKIIKIEKKEIERLSLSILKEQKNLQVMANLIAELDFYISMASIAIENKFSKPTLEDGPYSVIQDGRHPMVEKYFTKEPFVPNDLDFGNDDNILKIITGPNMSGKSTYIRMAAIIQLMAQIGSFVPAREAKISLVDRIFTRIGASDNISRGESTFLVEMNETANILNNATERSLVIMDEVGRGTSTYDGLSLAWAIVEYLQQKIKCKTLFATHYHELTQLGDKPGIKNYNVMVKETAAGVHFLHKVIEGAADKSYGIHVAKLAGMPGQIVKKATIILGDLETNQGAVDLKNRDFPAAEDGQLMMFPLYKDQIIQVLKEIDLDQLTPLEALQELDRLKKMLV